MRVHYAYTCWEWRRGSRLFNKGTSFVDVGDRADDGVIDRKIKKKHDPRLKDFEYKLERRDKIE
jgi:hypothetical protein